MGFTDSGVMRMKTVQFQVENGKVFEGTVTDKEGNAVQREPLPTDLVTMTMESWERLVQEIMMLRLQSGKGL